MKNSAHISLSRNQILIIFFIYVSIFINSYVFFTQPFEFYLGYLIYLVLLPIFMARYKMNTYLASIFLILLVTGTFNILIGNNSVDLFIKVFTGLTLSYFFYYYVIVEFNYDVDQLFRWYLYGSYIVSLIGIFQLISYQVNFVPGYSFNWILNKWAVSPGGAFGIRVNSVLAEPTYLASTLSAAFFVSVYNLVRKEGYGINKLQSFIIVFVYTASFSGLGQAGIFLTLFFLTISYGLIRYLIVIIPAVILLFNVLYNNVLEFKERFDSLVGLFSGTEQFKLGKTHGSSYILYNNFKVALENFKANFLFGSGIGSHPVAFEKYSIAKHIKVYGFNLNSADANSMFLRLLSETGLFGVLIFFVVMVKCYVARNEKNETYHWIISNAILVMILLNLFRQGHYFLNGFPFFVILYYFNYRSYQTYLETGKSLYENVIEEKEVVSAT